MEILYILVRVQHKSTEIVQKVRQISQVLSGLVRKYTRILVLGCC